MRTADIGMLGLINVMVEKSRTVSMHHGQEGLGEIRRIWSIWVLGINQAHALCESRAIDKDEKRMYPTPMVFEQFA